MVSSIMNGDDLFMVFFDSQQEFMMVEWCRDAFSQFWRVGDAFIPIFTIFFGSKNRDW